MAEAAPKRRKWEIPFLFVWLFATHLAPFAAPENLVAAAFTMAPPIFLGLPCFAAILLAFRRKLRFKWLFSFCLLVTLIPLLDFKYHAVAKHGWPADSVRVLSLNVHRGSREFPALLELIRKEKIEVVILQENLGGTKSPAQYLKGNLPGWFYVDDGREGAVLSQYPLRNMKVEDQKAKPALKFLSVDVQTPQPFRVLTAHWERPHVRKGFKHGVESQIQDCDQVLAAVESSPLPILVAGDFNLTPRSPLFARMCAQLVNSHDAAGYGTGWNYWAPFPLMRIDQSFVKGLDLTYSAVGPNIGSDHRPILTGFRFPE